MSEVRNFLRKTFFGKKKEDTTKGAVNNATAGIPRPSNNELGSHTNEDRILPPLLQRASLSSSVRDVVDENASVTSAALTDLTQFDARCIASRTKFQPNEVPSGKRPSSSSSSGLSVSDIMSVSSALSCSSTIVTSEALPTARLHLPPSIPIPATQPDENGFLSSPPYEGVVSVLFAGKTKKGHAPNNPKKPNQDSFFMKHDPNTSSLIIACFDGHGQYGHDVSRYCKSYMEKRICNHPSFHWDVQRAVMETTAMLEKDMLAAPHIDTVFSGTTMTLIIIRGTTVYVANVGDSRVVLGHTTKLPLLSRTGTGSTTEESHLSALPRPPRQGDGQEASSPDSDEVMRPTAAHSFLTEQSIGEKGAGAVLKPAVLQLSVDHKPDLPAERERIEQVGGRVKISHETARVYLATDDIPGLAMSRSLGDFVAHSAGVSSIPEFFEYDLPVTTTLGLTEGECAAVSGRHQLVRVVLLIGTDGVYDMMSNEAAVGHAFKHWGDPAAATEVIVSNTTSRWMGRWGLVDDTTLCIVNLELVS